MGVPADHGQAAVAVAGAQVARQDVVVAGVRLLDTEFLTGLVGLGAAAVELPFGTAGPISPALGRSSKLSRGPRRDKPITGKAPAQIRHACTQVQPVVECKRLKPSGAARAASRGVC